LPCDSDGEELKTVEFGGGSSGLFYPVLSRSSTYDGAVSRKLNKDIRIQRNFSSMNLNPCPYIIYYATSLVSVECKKVKQSL
jgi:hypothetical protein